MEFTESDPLFPLNEFVTIEGRDFLLLDQLSGLVYGGWNLEVGWELITMERASTAVPLPKNPFVVGGYDPALYNYSCTPTGTQVSTGTCPSGYTIVSGYQPGGQGGFSCIGGAVP
jgi:hypothetical protein